VVTAFLTSIQAWTDSSFIYLGTRLYIPMLTNCRAFIFSDLSNDLIYTGMTKEEATAEFVDHLGSQVNMSYIRTNNQDFGPRPEANTFYWIRTEISFLQYIRQRAKTPKAAIAKQMSSLTPHCDTKAGSPTVYQPCEYMIHVMAKNIRV